MKMDLALNFFLTVQVVISIHTSCMILMPFFSKKRESTPPEKERTKLREIDTGNFFFLGEYMDMGHIHLVIIWLHVTSSDLT